MFSPSRSNTNAGAGTNVYTSDKPKAASSQLKTTKPSKTITASKRSVAEINYPDPLPGGFQPGKKCLLF
ncbi:hypothetical protein SAMD00023353_0102800 [Rosellinia necatrix]|uniref:Uncharacterized protein n=1 Tax=Rosellinia necatrix TaxID=77044 RepID=A0A1S8A5A3_ROSNE|nr:hypothetical protein SAMD00023353_0102800 [Rosellinia necatrix]